MNYASSEPPVNPPEDQEEARKAQSAEARSMRSVDEWLEEQNEKKRKP